MSVESREPCDETRGLWTTVQSMVQSWLSRLTSPLSHALSTRMRSRGRLLHTVRC